MERPLDLPCRPSAPYLFHDLRHTCATLLLTKGVHPNLVSKMPGHPSIAITLDIYSRMIPGLGGAPARAMEDVLRSACLVRSLISYASLNDYVGTFAAHANTPPAALGLPRRRACWRAPTRPVNKPIMHLAPCLQRAK